MNRIGITRGCDTLRYHENRGTQACISHIVSKEHLEMYIYIYYIIYIQYTICRAQAGAACAQNPVRRIVRSFT